MISRGALTKEYSIYILARNNKLIHFTGASVKSSISLDGTPNDITRIEDSIFVSFFDGVIQVFSNQIVPLRTISTKDNIQGISNLFLEKLGQSKGIAVVGGGKLKVYDTTGTALLSSTTTEVGLS